MVSRGECIGMIQFCRKTRKRNGLARETCKTNTKQFAQHIIIAYFVIGENSSEISCKSALILSPERLKLLLSDKKPKAEPVSENADKLLKPPPPRPGMDP